MSERHQNRLARETSPYLLQHATNPVDWYPWGPEALERARTEQRPIFLSVGYSACHWCHVMERESFEQPDVAALMNRHFVNIKVDREERPDVDDIYMKAVQAMTGQGGWPMSVFLTPELEPFFGGTYFPPDDRHGRPGFPRLLETLAKMWADDPERLRKQGAALTEHIAQEARSDFAATVPADILDRSLAQLGASFDERWGGFGSAPKFPHSMDIRMCLRHWKRTKNPRALEAAITSLDRMAEGGIYDHLAGGFARYSTDERWLVPHFEKMLYDNALLVPAYLEAYLATGEEHHARVARETCDWMLAEMRTPQGAFSSALDADSEGEEGRFYVWTQEELCELLGEERGRWARVWYGTEPKGNWEGKNVLWRPQSAAQVAERLAVDEGVLVEAMSEARGMLLAAREKRVRPGLDDKVLVAWNGLAIAALAQAHQVLDQERFYTAAVEAARFILDSMRREDGRLYATSRAGKPHLNAYLDDHAFLIQGLLDLYESDFDVSWIRTALELDEIVREHFEDAERGGFYNTPDDHEALIARLKTLHDGALPCGGAVHALNLMRLAEWTGAPALARRAERAIRSLGKIAERHPAVCSQLLIAVDWLEAGPREVVLAGDRESAAFGELLRGVRTAFVPQRVVTLSPQGTPPEELSALLAGKQPGPGGEPRAFVCRNYACQEPVSNLEGLLEALS